MSRNWLVWLWNELIKKIVVILMFCLSKNGFYGGLQRDPVLHLGGRVRLILKTLDAEFVNFAIMFV